MKTIDIVMIPVSLAMIAAWIYAVIAGIKAARRKGISPHWMWFGVNPLTGLIAFAIIRWCAADRNEIHEAGDRAANSSGSDPQGINPGERVICQSWWATLGPDFLFRFPCILRITDQRVVVNYSYFDSLNSGLMTVVFGNVAIWAAYRAIKNKPKYATIPFDAIDILSIGKKVMATVYTVQIKGAHAWERNIKFALKPADAAQLFAAIPAFAREGTLGALHQEPLTQTSPASRVPEKASPGAFYYRANGVVVGPLDPSQLRQHATRGLIAPDSLVKRGEDGKWVSANHVKGLFGNTGH